MHTYTHTPKERERLQKNMYKTSQTYIIYFTKASKCLNSPLNPLQTVPQTSDLNRFWGWGGWLHRKSLKIRKGGREAVSSSHSILSSAYAYADTFSLLQCNFSRVVRFLLLAEGRVFGVLFFSLLLLPEYMQPNSRSPPLGCLFPCPIFLCN